MNIEDDDYCTADYGVFGEKNCECSSCRPPIQIYIPSRRGGKTYAEKLERERRASQEFNSHMIYLYNRGVQQ